MGAAGADRQLQPGRRLGHLAGVPPAGAARPDHVRPDDRRLVDLHRHPGHPAGHLRDVRRGRREAVRRHAGRHADPDRRLRRHGRRAAAGGHHERRRLPDRRRRPGPAATAGSSTATSTRSPTTSTTRSTRRLAAKRGPPGAVGRRGRQRRRRSFPELLRRGVDDRHRHRPDLARTTRCPTCRRASTLDDWADYAEAKPEEFTDRARESMARHVEAMVGFLDAGAEVFDYGNSIRDEARLGGYERAFAFPGFVPAYIRPLFCEGKGPFRWAALSGDPADIAATDRAVLDLFPDNDHLQPLDPGGPGAGRLPGPAGADLLARLRRAGRRPGCGSTRWWPPASSAPRSSSAATTSTAARSPRPYRETEAMADGSDAIADWPLLNALVNTASGATWVSIHHGGGVGIGRSIHAGQVTRRRRHRRWPPRSSTGCSPTTRAWASSGTSTPATTWPTQVAEERGVRVPMRGGLSMTFDDRPSTGLWADLAPVGRDAGHRRLPPVRLDRGRRRRCGSGSPARPRRRGLDVDDRPGTATCGPGGATRTPARPGWSPAATSTRCRTAARSTARSASSRAFARRRPAPRARASRPAGRSASPASPTRRAPASGSPAPGPGCSPARSTADRARALTDADGITLAEAMAAAGRDPARWAATTRPCGRIGAFVELHVEQGRALVDLGDARSASARRSGRTAAGGSTSAARPTTPAPPGWTTAHDPMLTSPRPCSPPGRRPSGTARSPPSARSACGPTASTPSRRGSPAWLDARGAGRGRRCDAVVAEVGDGRPGPPPVPRSRGPRTPPSTPPLRDRLAAPARTAPRPCCRTGAGHDAGILAAAGIPTAMLFVRNPTGRLALPRRARRRGRLPGRGRRAGRACSRTWRA